MKSFYLLLLLLSISFGKFSYTDKCYRFCRKTGIDLKLYYQYYINKEGMPLSNDLIFYDGGINNPEPDVKYYYHNVLSNCTKNDNVFDCISTTESIWFKIGNKTAAAEFISYCDPIFYKKYGDITKHNCTGYESTNPFKDLYTDIGKTTQVNIVMDGDVPIAPEEFYQDGECIWEYEILGLWSIVAIVVVSCCVVVALLFIAIIWFIAQKHRSNKRKRLESSLMHSTEMSSV